MKITFNISIESNGDGKRRTGYGVGGVKEDNQSKTRSTQSKSYHSAYGRN